MAVNMTVTRDRTQQFFLTLTQDGDALDLNGLNLYFTAKKAFADSTPVFQKSTQPAGGITITDATHGLATLTIDKSDTSSIPLAGIGNNDITLYCDFTIVSGSDPEPVDRGTLTVQLNVGEF